MNEKSTQISVEPLPLIGVAGRMKPMLNIGVRTLIRHVYRSGDLNLEFTSNIRVVDGIRVHQRIQKSRPENYTPEVSVSHCIETDQFRLCISGRIDGIYSCTSFENDTSVIIDEIKTTTRNLDYFQTHDEPAHWGQVKVYAGMYAFQNHLDHIQAQLTYVNLDSGDILELRKSFHVQELEKFLSDILARYLVWAKAIFTWRQARDRSIQDLTFPFTAFRSGQREMAAQVYRAIQSGEQLILQAPTGIGKTMATLFSAIKSLPSINGQKIFYLTARTTGNAAAENAVREMRRSGLRLKSLSLTAKGKLCPNAGSTCTPEECERAKGYYDRVNIAITELFLHDEFHRERIEALTSRYQLCPFEFSLELSLWVDCIVCDYNYVFDPKISLRHLLMEQDGENTFLVDEAHNLVDRSREMFSAQIQKQAFLTLRRKLKNVASHIYKNLGKINTWFVRMSKRCRQLGNEFSDKILPEDLVSLLKHFIVLSEVWLSRNMNAACRMEMLDLYFAVSGFLKVVERYDARYTMCIEKKNEEMTLRLFCIDPSNDLAQALNRCRAVVFFSGTMTPIPYFKKILGCRASAWELVLPSPFPMENFNLFISDRISTLYRHRRQTRVDVARMMVSFVHARKGNYLLFFPSYAYMSMIFESFNSETPHTKTIVQTAGMKESERDAFLMRFQAENPATLVGFAVMGGIFGEGIDLKGERLCGVGIVGVGLPGVCLERELIREYFTAYYGTGFEYAYVYPGINRVLQAAGRVIRSESDRGAVLLIDRRFSTSSYASLLPKHWRIIHAGTARHLESELMRFWNTV